jgi:hypothetical protein
LEIESLIHGFGINSGASQGLIKVDRQPGRLVVRSPIAEYQTEPGIIPLHS